MPLIRRHQLVYAALGDLMRTDIHALAMETGRQGKTAASAGHAREITDSSTTRAKIDFPS